nr:hypothetical protein [Candidatus Njordarchaeota archaeon]
MNARIGEYMLDSIQLYFNASLEIQEELINHGFRVPLETPLPIVYGDVSGYLDGRTSRIALKAAILDPIRYGKSISEMGWKELGRKIEIKREYAKLLLDTSSRGGEELIIVSPKFEENTAGYHLEKASYRGVSQTYWKNWAGYYLSLDELKRMAEDLQSRFGRIPSSQQVYWTHESLPKGGGHEDTYFVSFDANKRGIEPHSYSICMGCWDNVIQYLESEAERYPKIGLPKPNPDVKLRIEKDEDIPIRMKIGVAKMDEKRPQFMIKFSTVPTASRTIQGIDEEGKPITIKGKPRGKLVPCNHKRYFHEVSFSVQNFVGAIYSTNNFVRKKEEIGRMRYPSWLGD